MNPQARSALVTGGARRIGRAICEALAARGCRVAIHCRESGSEADKLAAALIRLGAPKAVVIRGSLDSEPECRAVVDRAWDALGRLDVLVNNAAVFHKDGLLDTTAAKLAAELQINAFAPVFLTRAFALRALKARRRVGAGGGPQGHVINLLDRRVAGVEAGCLPYLLSKKMLADFTRIAALELAPRMAVNGVAPGPVLPPPGRGTACIRDRAGPVPLRVRCRPRHVAEAVLFLLEAEAVTGQIVFVDGGQHLLSP